MIAVRLHGPRDLRLDTISGLEGARTGEVVLRVAATGICGSDLHTYNQARIGDTVVARPLILGHEFSGIVEECGPGAVDNLGAPLREGMLVAVDPATPCGVCDSCRHGDEHLCTALHFCGLSPDDGSLTERMLVRSRNCFSLPASLDAVEGAMLEPFGVALHAVRLGKITAGKSAAVIGAGPIGLLIIQLLIRKGIVVHVSEPLSWRRNLAVRFGALPIGITNEPTEELVAATKGCGVDVVFEAAWADSTVQEALSMARPGGRVVLVGIPEDDRIEIPHSVGRRKGLTLLFSRRMHRTYPDAIALVESHAIDVHALVSHRIPLRNTPEAFALNAHYEPGVLKVMIDHLSA
ncbi:MAG: alcohol dehydrogenase catalytic domain-containing protein [Bacteroidota bacterium]